MCHVYFFFFNDTATTEIYTLSLHDALPIFPPVQLHAEAAGASTQPASTSSRAASSPVVQRRTGPASPGRRPRTCDGQPPTPGHHHPRNLCRCPPCGAGAEHRAAPSPPAGTGQDVLALQPPER